jgi:hypothetical protein
MSRKIKYMSIFKVHQNKFRRTGKEKKGTRKMKINVCRVPSLHGTRQRYIFAEYPYNTLGKAPIPF